MKSLCEYIKESAMSDTATEKINGFCILKPGFLDHEDDWYKMLDDEGWQIKSKKKLKMSHELASNLYSCHKDKDFYNDLCDYMSSDDCVCCKCYKDCKDPVADMKKIKHTCRDKWGEDEMRNAMHSSDSLNNVKRECELIFD